MNKTFADMKANVGLELQDTSTPFNVLIGKFLNRRYFQCLRTINWGAINFDYTLTLVAGQRDYALPVDFKSAVYCLDSTNNLTFTEVRADGFADQPSQVFEQTTPYSYTVFDAGSLVQPTAASAVTIVSSLTTDTSTTVTVKGDVGGVETRETLTLNGTTNVTGTASFTRIKSITKDVTNGSITVTCNSQTVGLLSPETKIYRVKKIRFFGIPDSALTLSIPYHILPMPLVNDYDVPVIDIDDCLEAGARADGWRYKRQGAKAQVEDANFFQLLSDYQWQLESNPNLSNQFKPVAYPRD